MYKSDNKLQSSFLDFNQPMGLHMNPGMSQSLYVCRLGALIIQTRFQYSVFRLDCISPY